MLTLKIIMQFIIWIVLAKININRALLVIRNEFRKKDDKIKKLELKVAELENQINMITKTNNFQSNNANNNNSNIINLTQKKIGKNPFYAEQYSEILLNKFKNIKYEKCGSNRT